MQRFSNTFGRGPKKRFPKLSGPLVAQILEISWSGGGGANRKKSLADQIYHLIITYQTVAGYF